MDECECGAKHEKSIEKVVICDDAHLLLQEKLQKIDKKILVICEKDNFSLAQNLFKNCSFLCLDVEPSTDFAESIQPKDEELVVAFGNESLISVCKYFCLSFSLPLCAVIVGECLDFTFSTFARLYDGVQFSFYHTPIIKEIYYPLSLNKYDCIYDNYIASKFIAYFDNVVGKLVYKQKPCEKLEKFFKNALLSYNFEPLMNEEDKLYKCISFLSKIGQGMAYFNQTKYFFGGERAVTEILAMFRKKASYLQLNYVSLKLLINCYSCFYSAFPFDGMGNITKQINELTKILNICPTEVMSRLAPSELLFENNIKQTFSGYFPYLKGVLDKCLKKAFLITSGLNINIKLQKSLNLDAKTIEKSLALSSVLYSKPCSLHLMFVFGYLDKLL